MPPNFIFLYFVKIKYIENIKKPFAIRITNQPSDSDIIIWVLLKNCDDASRLLKTINVMDIKKITDSKKRDLLSWSIYFI